MTNEEIWPEPKERGNNMTIEERLENMERELGRLKRRNRWLLGAILLVAGGLAVLVLFKTTPFQVRTQAEGTVKEVRANRISLVDENDKILASLSADKDGSRLEFYDENEASLASLNAKKDGSTLTLWDLEHRSLAVLGAQSEYGPSLSLSASAKARAFLSADKDGSSRLSLSDENGKTRASLDVDKDGPKLYLFDENESFRLVAGTTELVTSNGKKIKYPESSLILFGPDGKVIWSAIK